MSREEKQQTQQAELQKQLWSIANTLRGNMDANDFKNYILGLIFYRYLSENLVNYVERTLLKDDGISYVEAWKNDEYRAELKRYLIEDSNMGYFIEADNLWSELIYKIQTGKFDISMLSKAINSISDSTLGNESEDDFENLFEDMDLNNSKLGRGEAERTKLISTIMLKINDIIAILDVDTLKESRNNLRILNMLKNQSSDIKSVILIEKKGESQEYFSVISSNTLKRRIEQICATRTF